jgi:hypothetical protein
MSFKLVYTVIFRRAANLSSAGCIDFYLELIAQRSIWEVHVAEQTISLCAP